MCLIIFGLRSHPEYPFLLAANRDEFYDRPTRPLGFWEEKPHILAGKDLQAGGTWLGISKSGRFAAVTNYRDPKNIDPKALSRGELVTKYLDTPVSNEDFVKWLQENSHKYNGFNILYGNFKSITWFCNKNGENKTITAGIHGLSNAFLDTPWPKLTTAKDRFTNVIQKKSFHPQELISIMEDNHTFADEKLPDTGVGLSLEKVLSPIFIKSPVYGTRCTSVIAMDNNGKVSFWEKSENKMSAYEVHLLG